MADTLRVDVIFAVDEGGEYLAVPKEELKGSEISDFKPHDLHTCNVRKLSSFSSQ